MLIDTHAHLDFPDFTSDLDDIPPDRAAAPAVTRVISIGTSVESSRRAVALAEKYPQVYAVIGVHPNSAHEADGRFHRRPALLLSAQPARRGDWRDRPRLLPTARRQPLPGVVDGVGQ